MQLRNGDVLAVEADQLTVIVDEILQEVQRPIVLMHPAAGKGQRHHVRKIVVAQDPPNARARPPYRLCEASCTSRLSALLRSLIGLGAPKVSDLVLVLTPLAQPGQRALPLATKGIGCGQLPATVGIVDHRPLHKATKDLTRVCCHVASARLLGDTGQHAIESETPAVIRPVSLGGVSRVHRTGPRTPAARTVLG